MFGDLDNKALKDQSIRKAMELISFENLTPEARTRAKNKEASMVTIVKIESRRNF